jgi:bifunctional non-homologous end joining protein LigD
MDPCGIEGAHAAALPAKLKLQLPTLVAAVPSGDQWLHEIKYDGYRLIARLARGKVKLRSRNGNDWTAKFPTIAAALRDLPVKNGLLDGEVVHEQPNGITSFSLLAIDLSEGRTEHLVYYVFDLPYLNGCSVMASRLEERKRFLEALLAPRSAKLIRYSKHVEGDGPAFYAKCCSLALEGVVSKRRDAPYIPGHGHGWLKIKCAAREEFAIIGWTDPAGSREGLGSLLLGYYDAQGNLHYAGRVGTGFTRAVLRELRSRLDQLTVNSAPRAEIAAAAPKHSHWVIPALVAEVRFTEWTRDRRLRHPVFLGLREDKKGRDVILDPAIGTALDRSVGDNEVSESVLEHRTQRSR